ncbi:acid phosphatase [Zalerion maritima]|uniref:Acid phosphatase n=1 Tax=Zalerion maritima TaxID=339359 RepID=A0AAD5WQF9_9PEZI|nr:acid phosphatase [Zalerion maritima]
MPGELTDRGRETSLAFGKWLRRLYIDRIVADEMFRGYGVSRELRMLGAGQLVGDIVLKMVDQVEWNRRHDILRDPTMQSSAPPKLSLLGCHDRTMGVVLASLGCLNGRPSPATSSLSCFARDGRLPQA